MDEDFKYDFLFDKDRLEQARKEQAEQREKWKASGYVRGRHKTAFEKKMDYSVRCLETAETNLAFANPSDVPHHKDRIAELLIEQGRFKDAAEIAHSEHRKTEALRLHEAEQLDDEATCDCPNFTEAKGANDTVLQIPTRYVKDKVWSNKYNAEMPLIACSLCGHLNIAPMPQELKDLDTVRDRASQHFNKDVQTMKRNLSQAGLTAERILQ